jgi:alpha-tubulin suppressor-like RCC1 family protein
MFIWRRVLTVKKLFCILLSCAILLSLCSCGKKDDVSEKEPRKTGIIMLSGGYEHSAGLNANGTVVAVGSNEFGQCDVTAWTDVIAITAGKYFTAGLKSDGTVVAVGSNLYGQLNTEEWTDIVAISAGYHHLVGLKSDGTVVAVGDNRYYQCNLSE